MAWEISFLEWLTNLGSANPNMNWLSWIFLIITFTCDKGLIWIVLCIVLIFVKKTRRVGLCMAISLIIFSVIINDLIVKNLVARGRPFGPEGSRALLDNVNHWFLSPHSSFMGLFEVPDDYSFPSGHTGSSFLGATILMCYNRKAGIGAYIFAFIMAFTRLYFGVHYPTDVIFGLIYGVGAGFLGYFLFELIIKRTKLNTKLK